MNKKICTSQCKRQLGRVYIDIWEGNILLKDKRISSTADVCLTEQSLHSFINYKKVEFLTTPRPSLAITLNQMELCEILNTLACGCWKVSLELLMSDEYLNRWLGEEGNLWLLLGWLCRTAEKQMWTVSFSAFSCDSCPRKRLHTEDTWISPSIHMKNECKPWSQRSCY